MTGAPSCQDGTWAVFRPTYHAASQDVHRWCYDNFLTPWLVSRGCVTFGLKRSVAAVCSAHSCRCGLPAPPFSAGSSAACCLQVLSYASRHSWLSHEGSFLQSGLPSHCGVHRRQHLSVSLVLLLAPQLVYDSGHHSPTEEATRQESEPAKSSTARLFGQHVKTCYVRPGLVSPKMLYSGCFRQG